MQAEVGRDGDSELLMSDVISEMLEQSALKQDPSGAQQHC